MCFQRQNESSTSVGGGWRGSGRQWQNGRHPCQRPVRLIVRQQHQRRALALQHPHHAAQKQAPQRGALQHGVPPRHGRIALHAHMDVCMYVYRFFEAAAFWHHHARALKRLFGKLHRLLCVANISQAVQERVRWQEHSQHLPCYILSCIHH